MGDLTLSAVCGLYCGVCAVYLATQENDEAKLKYIADMFGTTPELIKCDGCRSDRLTVVCSDCVFKPCAEKRKLDFCGECSELPCRDFSEFQEAKPHRIELYESFEMIKADGSDKWQEYMKKRHTCPACGALNSSYDIKCRKCGAEPSCEYVEKHADRIREYFKKR